MLTGTPAFSLHRPRANPENTPPSLVINSTGETVPSPQDLLGPKATPTSPLLKRSATDAEINNVDPSDQSLPSPGSSGPAPPSLTLLLSPLKKSKATQDPRSSVDAALPASHPPHGLSGPVGSSGSMTPGESTLAPGDNSHLAGDLPSTGLNPEKVPPTSVLDITGSRTDGDFMDLSEMNLETNTGSASLTDCPSSGPTASSPSLNQNGKSPLPAGSEPSPAIIRPDSSVASSDDGPQLPIHGDVFPSLPDHLSEFGLPSTLMEKGLTIDRTLDFWPLSTIVASIRVRVHPATTHEVQEVLGQSADISFHSASKTVNVALESYDDLHKLTEWATPKGITVRMRESTYPTNPELTARATTPFVDPNPAIAQAIKSNLSSFLHIPESAMDVACFAKFCKVTFTDLKYAVLFEQGFRSKGVSISFPYEDLTVRLEFFRGRYLPTRSVYDIPLGLPFSALESAIEKVQRYLLHIFGDKICSEIIVHRLDNFTALLVQFTDPTAAKKAVNLVFHTPFGPTSFSTLSQIVEKQGPASGSLSRSLDRRPRPHRSDNSELVLFAKDFASALAALTTSVTETRQEIAELNKSTKEELKAVNDKVDDNQKGRMRPFKRF